MILAEIMSGEVDLADVLFLFAFLVTAVAAILYFTTRNYAMGLLSAGSALIAFGLMAL